MHHHRRRLHRHRRFADPVGPDRTGPFGADISVIDDVQPLAQGGGGQGEHCPLVVRAFEGQNDAFRGGREIDGIDKPGGPGRRRLNRGLYSQSGACGLLRPTLQDLGMGNGDILPMLLLEPLQQNRYEALNQAPGQPDHHRRTVGVLPRKPDTVFRVDVLGGDAVEGVGHWFDKSLDGIFAPSSGWRSRHSNKGGRRNPESLTERTYLANVEVSLASEDFRDNALASNIMHIDLLEAVLLHQKL